LAGGLIADGRDEFLDGVAHALAVVGEQLPRGGVTGVDGEALGGADEVARAVDDGATGLQDGRLGLAGGGADARGLAGELGGAGERAQVVDGG